MEENNIKKRFLDEEILDLKNQKRKLKYRDIKEGVYIKNQLVEFEETFILNNGIKIWLPKNFIDLPENMKKIKYPSEERPTEIKSSLDTSINFGFSYLDIELTASLLEYVKQIKKFIKKLNPTYEFFEINSLDINDINVAYFDFKSTAIDTPMYNIIGMVTNGNKVVHFVFNCSFRDCLEWKYFAIESFKTIDFIN